MKTAVVASITDASSVPVALVADRLVAVEHAAVVPVPHMLAY